MQKSLHSEQHHLFLEMLKNARLAGGVTQAELADALGMQQTDISKVERGVRRLDVLELHAWLTALHTPFVAFTTTLDEQLEALTVRRQGGRRRSVARPGK